MIRLPVRVASSSRAVRIGPPGSSPVTSSGASATGASGTDRYSHTEPSVPCTRPSRFRARTLVGQSGSAALRVDLNLDWATAAPPTQEPVADSPDTLRPPVTFDVLVTGADTAAPRVVAWGGPGTGPTLVPYGNAVPADTTPAQATEVVTWEPPAASHGPAG